MGVDDRIEKLRTELKAARERIAELENLALRQGAANGGGMRRKPGLDSLMQSPRFGLDSFEMTCEGVAVGDAEGCIRQADAVFCDIVGREPGEVIGRRGYDFMTEESRQVFLEKWNKGIQGPEDVYELTFLRKDGTPVEVMATGRPVFDETRTPACVFRLVVDVAGRERIEKQLRESEERFRQVYENMVIGVARVSLDFLIEAANEAYCDMLGYSEAELIGRHLKDITHPEVVDENLRKQAMLARGEIDHYRMKKRFFHKSGKIVHGVLDANLVRDEKGRPSYFMGSVLDITECKRSEEALVRSREEISENQAKLSLALSLARLAPWEMDIKSAEFTLSDQFYELYATSAEREGGCVMSTERYAREFVHPEDAWMVDDEAGRILKSDDPDFTRQLEHRIIRRDGEIRHILVRYKLLRNRLGEPVKTIGANQDVTEHKLAERALRTSEANFRAFFDNAGEGIIISDSKSNILQVNPMALQLLGYDSPEALVGTNAQGLVHPEDQAVIAVYEAVVALQTQGTLRFERRYRKSDGSWINVDVTLSLVPGTDFHHVLFRDITERKNFEKKLRQSEERLSLALDTVNEGVWDWRVDTGDVYFNSVWYTMLGYDPDEMPAEFATWRSIVHPEDLPGAERTIKRHLEIAQPFDMEYRMRTKAGEWRWINARGRVVEKDDSGRAVRMIGTHQDIMDRKLAEEKLIQAKHAAETANQAKSEFLANMSHEIRTPLNGVMGMLQLIQLCGLDSEPREYAATAVASCKRLAKLLGDILDLSRIEAGRLRLSHEPFTVGEVMESVEKLFGPSAGQAGLALHTTVDERIPRLVGDCNRVHQVLNNLVGNAIKFTDAGAIKVEAYLLPIDDPAFRRVLFQVSDTGIGIPDDILNNLFQPFTQADGSFSRKYGGAGLGLSITKGLLDLMGGNISVSSEFGVGSNFQFIVTFDVAPGASEIEPASRLAEKTTVLDLRALLVEDDPVNQTAIRRMAEKSGCKVKVVGNGEEAIAALRTGNYDVVVMDIEMPVMNGVEATRAIRRGEAGAENKHIPIVALTAFAMAGDKEKFLEVGVDEYLAKPVELDQLRRVLRLAADKRLE